MSIYYTLITLYDAVEEKQDMRNELVSNDFIL